MDWTHLLILAIIIIVLVGVARRSLNWSSVKPTVDRPVHDSNTMDVFKSTEYPLGVYAVRPMERVSGHTQKLVDLITVRDNTRPVGSFKWLVHRYPGDIDIMERLTECCSSEDASKKIVAALQNVVADIQADDTAIVGDVKAGVDQRFKLDIGSLDVHTNTVTGYNREATLLQLNALHLSGLLSDSEYHTMLQAAYASPEVDAWNSLKEQLRQLYTLRWTVPEISSGVKALRGGTFMTLEDAIDDPTIVKIDMLAKVNGNFTEVTNFFLLAWEGPRKSINVYDPSAFQLEKRLNADIVKHASAAYYNPMKLLKRLWNYSTLKTQPVLATTLAPIFGSDVAKLKQVSSEIETLVLLLENESKYLQEQGKVVDVGSIMDQVDKFHRRIADIMQFDFDAAPMHSLINQTLRAPTSEQAVTALVALKKEIDAVVFTQADRFFKQNQYVFEPYIDAAIQQAQ